jgi:hypothetical protein
MPLSRPRLAVALVSFVSFVSLLACSDSTDPAPSTTASLEATGPTDTLGITDTVRVGAIMRDGDGAVLPGVTITWRSLHPLVARVDDDGLVTGLAAGNASIVATAAGRSAVADTVVVRVRRIPPMLAVTGLADSSLAVYEPRRSGAPLDTVVATVRDASGTTLTVPVRWSSSDTTIATVSATGIVTVREPGIAWIRADAGRSAVDSVRVRGFIPAVAGPPFASFSIGHSGTRHLGFLSCGLATTGEAWCGSGSTLATQPAPGGLRFRSVAVGDRTACGLVAADSTLACWGLNGVAQLGIGTTTPASVATPVIAASGRKFQVADVGPGNTMCAVGVADSLVYCWGGNQVGATGDAPAGADSTVGPVPGLPKALAVAVGAWHACAIVIDGSVWCWGDAGVYASVQGLGAARFRPPAQMTPAAGTSPSRRWTTASACSMAREWSAVSWVRDSRPAGRSSARSRARRSVPCSRAAARRAAASPRPARSTAGPSPSPMTT